MLRVIPMNDRGELLMEEYEKLLNPRTRMVAVAHVSNALGTINPVRADHRDGAQRGRPDADRRRPGRAAHQGGRAGARLRFLHLLRPQGLSAPPASASSTARPRCSNAMPPYQGGGDMIQVGHVRKDHLQRSALQVRSRHAQHRRRHRTGRGDRLRQRASASTSIAAYEHELLVYGTEALSQHSRPAPHRHRAREGQRALLRDGRHSSARYRHGARPAGHRGAHRPPLRAAGDGLLRRPRHHARLARRSTTPSAKSTRSSPASKK